MRNQFTPKFEELPSVISLFPLKGAVVLPHGQLLLNIFEPRYLNMVFDAISGDRLLGMIQPRETPKEQIDNIHHTGCAGRIVSFSETRDDHVVLLLSGVSRFDIDHELQLHNSYRRAEVSWRRFSHDLDDEQIDFDRDQLLSLAKVYLEHHGLAVEWSSLSNLKFPELVDTLASSLPFSPREKQGVVETLTIQGRCELIAALCKFTAGHSMVGGDRAH
jgi:Lon protease-like protein